MKVKLTSWAWFSVIIVGIISAVKIIHEPDLWWQIRTGQWILDNQTVPKVDVFSYTFINEPWINVKWFAEVLMALVNDFFGSEWLILLQIACIVLILLFAQKLNKALAFKLTAVQPKWPTLGIMIAGLLLLLTINYRMNSRPEMFSHLLVIVFLYYLFKYSQSNSNWLFIIIPLQILWTNTHEAFGMGIVLIIIFLVAHWTEFFLFQQKKPLKFTLVGLLAISGSAVNPNGIKMIAHPFNIFGQLSENKFTTELLGYKDEAFWQYQAYVLIIVFIICLLFILKNKKDRLFGLEGVARSIGLPYALIVLAFFYLSLTAFRNIPFFIIVCTPILANFIDRRFNFNSKKPFYSILALSFLFYCLIASNVFYEKLLPREQFGIGVNSTTTPIGAAQFLKSNDINGKGFVDYLTSAYFLYELQPHYQTFIDLRDLDIFHTEFFEKTFTVYQAPTSMLSNGQQIWDYYKDLDKFNYIVLLNSPPFKGLNNHLVHQDDLFELVYADNLNSIYLRNTPENQPLINQHGYLQGKNDVFVKLTNYENSKGAAIISKLLWPFGLSKEKEQPFSVYKRWYYQYIGMKAPQINAI